MYSHGQSFDLYAYTDEKTVFHESLTLVLTALVCYILLVSVLQMLRRRSACLPRPASAASSWRPLP